MRHLDNMAKIILVTGIDGRLRLRDGVLHRLVQREPVRDVHVPEPRARAVRLGLLDHGHLQRDRPAALLVQEGAHERPRSCSSLSILVNIGMWFERFVIIVTSLHRDFLPSVWGYFTPTLGRAHVCWAASGCSSRCSCCSCRFLPMVAMAEVKTVLPQADPHRHGTAPSARSRPPAALPGRGAEPAPRGL